MGTKAKVPRQVAPPLLPIFNQRSRPHHTLQKTKQLHALLVTTCSIHLPLPATKILRFYAINSDLTAARLVFDQITPKTVYLWNSMIKAYGQNHRFHRAFSLFTHMLSSETPPDYFTFACLLRACSEKFDFAAAKMTHSAVIVSGYELDLVAGRALVIAYSKLGLIDDARQAFDKMPEPDLISWNSMISGYGSRGFWAKSIELFNWMGGFGIKPDGFSFVGLISCMWDPNLVKIGRSIHGFSLKNGCDLNSHVRSGLVSMYSKCNCLDSAYKLFTSLSNPDLVTWSALITGVSYTGDCKKALSLFRKMNFTGKKSDPILISIVLAACARSAMAGPGSEMHGSVFRRGFELEIAVSCALISMYSKSGFAKTARRVFDIMPEKTVVAYNSMISGLGLHGFGLQSIEMFEQMLQEGLKPDKSTFSALLCTCCHCGLVENGQNFFRRMEKEFGIRPRTEHYVYIVNLLGLAGKLEEAYDIIRTLPESLDSGILGALLSGCRLHGDSKLGEMVGRELFEIEPGKTAYRVILSNIYAADGRWGDVKRLRDEMVEKGLKKTPGFSWIEENR